MCVVSSSSGINTVEEVGVDTACAVGVGCVIVMGGGDAVHHVHNSDIHTRRRIILVFRDHGL